MRRIFVYIKFLMAFIILFDSVSVFGRVNRSKKKKRSRVALSSRIVRGKGKQNNIKNGELKFEKPGSVFKKIEQDTRQASGNQTPPPKQNEPTQPQPEPPKNDIPTENDVVPPMRSPLPYVSPYVSKYPTQKAKPKQKEDLNKELKETITQLKSKIASSKNTCGAYTKTMADINKQLGLGVSLSSGIGLGLSAVATATGTGSYLMSKKQDKNFANHKEKQDGIIKMAENQDSLLNFNGGTGDNDDLSKIAATNKTLETKELDEYNEAQEDLEQWKKDNKIAELKTKEQLEQEYEDLKKKLEQDTEEMPQITIPDNLKKALHDAKEMSIEPKAKTPSEQPQQPAKDPKEEQVAKLEKDAEEAMKKALAMPETIKEDPKKPVTPATRTQEEIYADGANKKLEGLQARLAELQKKQTTDDEIKNKTLATLQEEQKTAQEKYDRLKNQKHSNKDKKYVHECKRIQNFIVSNAPNSNPTYNEIERLEPVKVDRIKWGTMFGLQNNTLQWRNIVSHLNTYKYCCKTGCLITNDCELIEAKEDNEAKKTAAYNLLQAAKDKVKAKKIEEKLQAEIVQLQGEVNNAQIDFDTKNNKVEAAKKEAAAKQVEEQKAREAEIAKLKKAKEDAIAKAEQDKKNAEEERKKLNQKKEQDKIAAAEKEKQDKEAEVEKLKKDKEDAIAKAEQDINDYIAKEEEQWKRDKKAQKTKLLTEKETQKDEAIKQVEKLQQELQEKEKAIRAKKELADKQQAMLKQQEQESAEFTQKRKALSDSAGTIQKNHKVARGLDITTATLSAVSAVSSGVSMGFSIATIEAVKKALIQLKECKADIYQIKLLNGKYLALTAEE